MAPTLIVFIMLAIVLMTVGIFIYTIVSILWLLLRAIFWPIRLMMQAGRQRHPIIEPNRCRNKLCGAKCPANASFCPRCGRPVLRVVEPTVYMMPQRGCRHANLRVTSRTIC